GLLFLAIAIGAAGTAWGLMRAVHQKREAEHQARIARQTTDFLTSMFQSVDPVIAKLRDPTAAKILELAGLEIGTAFPNDPLSELPLRRTLVDVCTRLGHEDLALPHAESALRLAKLAYGDRDGAEVAESLDGLASCLSVVGRPEDAL